MALGVYYLQSQQECGRGAATRRTHNVYARNWIREAYLQDQIRVSGCRRVPDPPARMTPFMRASVRLRMDRQSEQEHGQRADQGDDQAQSGSARVHVLTVGGQRQGSVSGMQGKR